MIQDVIRIVVTYLRPNLRELCSFFVGHKFNLNMRFTFELDNLRLLELNILRNFPNIKLKGVSVRVRAKDRLKGFELVRLKMYTLTKYVDKNLALCGSRLQFLDLSNCSKLIDLNALCFCRNLKILDLTNCVQIRMLPLWHLHLLEKLVLKGCVGIRDIGVIKCNERLRYLSVERCHHLCDIDVLGELVELRYVNLRYTGIKNVGVLRKCRKLRYVFLRSCELYGLEALRWCVKLRYLDVVGCKSDDASFLNYMQLKSIGLDGDLMRLVVIGNYFVSLRRLVLTSCKDKELIHKLGECVRLEELELNRCEFGVSFIRDLVRLRILRFVECWLFDGYGLSGCHELEDIEIRNCGKFRNYEWLTLCPKLRRIVIVGFLYGCYGMLGKCENLVCLELSHYRGDVFEELRHLGKLERLKLGYWYPLDCMDHMDHIGDCCKYRMLKELDLSCVKRVHNNIDIGVLVGCSSLELVRVWIGHNFRGIEQLELKGIVVESVILGL